ncbi:MAG TPA: bifunctional DNA-formamidopyrimidine glycosylase/DNA-(apurinic or apyrimidinic site) lyase [Gemmatimonadales bacterium]|nr:bifunctional DNA-formamidopyrimidine glycosylase/DNA-(apurinic or apyrimidinic site) lyase [Gemmatimonadales bacterium]
MPELPEVETIARDVRPHLVGATLSRVRLFKSDVLRGIRPRAFLRSLEGRSVKAVTRRAKHLVILLGDGNRLIIQPRMTGSLTVERGLGSDPYAVIEADLSTGGRLRYRDVRRLGAVHLLGPDAWKRYTGRIGPEPLERSFTPARLAGALAGGVLAVKKALMDQRRLAGVGNIYANEALWRARVDPSRSARTITPVEVRRLHQVLVAILRSAIRRRGTTVRDYRTGTGEAGEFQERLDVYGRAGQGCRRCGPRRRIALTHAIDGRATYFCPGCQH